MGGLGWLPSTLVPRLRLHAAAAPADHGAVQEAGRRSATGVRRIGRITAEGGTTVLDRHGTPLATPWASFDHFAA